MKMESLNPTIRLEVKTLSTSLLSGSTDMIKDVYTKANESELLKRDTRWTLVFEDFKSESFDLKQLADQTNILQMTDGSCCKILDKGITVYSNINKSIPFLKPYNTRQLELIELNLINHQMMHAIVLTLLALKSQILWCQSPEKSLQRLLPK